MSKAAPIAAENQHRHRNHAVNLMCSSQSFMIIKECRHYISLLHTLHVSGQPCFCFWGCQFELQLFYFVVGMVDYSKKAMDRISNSFSPFIHYVVHFLASLLHRRFAIYFINYVCEKCLLLAFPFLGVLAGNSTH